jgi:D-sedoheptulose 7-phosphate isomerase
MLDFDLPPHDTPHPDMDLIDRISRQFQDSAQTKLDAIEWLAAPIAQAIDAMTGSLVNNG